MKPAYRVFPVDLSVAFSSLRLTDAGQVVTSITVQSLPAGSSATLVIGQNSDAIPMVAPTQTFNMCPGCDEGVFVINTTPVAGQLVILVSFDNNLTAQAGT